MNFEVEVVPDDALPASITRVMVERTGGAPPLLILAESVAAVWSFVCDWADEEEPVPGPVACCNALQVAS